MKKTGVFALLLRNAHGRGPPIQGPSQAPDGTTPATTSFPIERIPTRMYANLHCAGFFSQHRCPDANYIIRTPPRPTFQRGDVVYLRGTG